MKLEAYVIAEEGKVLVVREDEPDEMMNQMCEAFGLSSDVEISEDDPRLTQEVLEDNPNADAYELATTISIY